MNRNEILKLIAQIRGFNDDEKQLDTNSSTTDALESVVGSETCVSLDSDGEIGDSESISEHIRGVQLHGEISSLNSDLDAMVKKYGGKIYNDRLVDADVMSRKEYLSIVRDLTRDQVVSHPLVHVLFRSEGQSSSNFFEWINSFKEKR